MYNPITYIIIYLAIVNLIAAIVVAVDKHRAQHHQWRIPEKTLFLLAIFGGTPGTYLTMRAIRHKTKHKRFMIGLPAIFILQVLTAAGLIILKIRLGAA